MFKRTVCDCCGKVDPPLVEGSRVTQCCMRDGGFYRRDGEKMGSDGKACTQYFQFPILIRWIGFWSWIK